MASILTELEWWRPQLEGKGKLIEAQRLQQRTMFDLEMMKEIGYCHGIENYSRHFSGRLPGDGSRAAEQPHERGRAMSTSEQPDDRWAVPRPQRESAEEDPQRAGQEAAGGAPGPPTQWEGYDAAIIAMLPLDQHRPALIRFEHRHLGPQEHAQAVSRLVANGYRVAVNEDDTIAMQHQPGRGLTACS